MSRKRKTDNELQRVNPRAAGIDIGSASHWVAVDPSLCDENVREFGAYTDDLHTLAEWLGSLGVQTVAMESTGVYWIPLYEILAARGMQVLLANAREVKHVPGRKTDVNDAQWLQQLHTFGLLRGSFHPPAEIAALRAYLRQRERLVDYAAQHVQHMQKALTPMNLKLQHVVADITGQTGLQIIRAILAGTRDPQVLANYRDRRCRHTVEEIAQALEGHYRPEHVFALEQALSLYEAYQERIAAWMQEFDRQMTPARPLLGFLPEESAPAPAQVEPVAEPAAEPAQTE